MIQQILDIEPSVKEALATQQAVVALESTIIAHGMPYPQNVETALAVEALVRAQGATPATIGIIEGRIQIGMSAAQLDRFGNDPHVLKVSTRSIPYVLAQKLMGATTVSATVRLAALAGIKIMVTGGIGGVHRGYGDVLDISTDLTELATTPVAVIAAGVKSILDIQNTLEYLETVSVPVIGFQTTHFPAFYTPQSGYECEFALQTPAEIARFLQLKWALSPIGGALIANPIPQAHSMNQQVIDQAITQALAECEAKSIRGKKITPFLLERIQKLTAGQSLVSNIALVKNNAVVGGQIAKALTAV